MSPFQIREIVAMAACTPEP